MLNFRILTLNTWHSGDSVDFGISKLVKHIRHINPDVAVLQELEGDNFQRILRALGPLWSGVESEENGGSRPETGVITKHRINRTSVVDRMEAGLGCQVDITAGGVSQSVSIWSVHLDHNHYGPYIACQTRDSEELKAQVYSYDRRMRNIMEIMSDSTFKLHDKMSNLAPLIVAGDFNEPSHLDWTKEAAEVGFHCGHYLQWPVSLKMQRRGMIDSFRAAHPSPLKHPGNTWATIYKTRTYEDDMQLAMLEEPQDRIDFIYHKSNKLEVTNAETYCGGRPIDEYPDHRDNDWPSDHYAVFVDFKLELSNDSLEYK